MPSDPWQALFAAELATLDAGHLLRRRRVVRPLDAVRVEVDGATLVNFASNDYLGLARHPRVVAAAADAARAYGAGSGAAPLITGYTPAHAAAESAIAAWKGTEAAVLFPSGFQANLALVQALAAVAGRGGRSVRFLLDKLCHASLVDAARAASSDGDGGAATFRVFPHNGMAKLGRLLGRRSTGFEPVSSSDATGREPETGERHRLEACATVVLTESIFSMDGDAADLPALARLARAAGAFLVVDEAHGSGVYGPAGAGLAAELGLAADVDATVVTLSKAVGVIGAAVCGPRALCDVVVNLGRPYVFSTSIPAHVAAAAAESVAVMRDEPHRQARVRALARHVRAELSAAGFDLPPGDSPIVPILLGDEQSAVAAAGRLADMGLLVLPIRPPTVPRGTSRLRVTLSCEQSDEQVELLLRGLKACLKPTGEGTPG